MSEPQPRAQSSVHSIDRFVLSVPDVAAAGRFFTHFGLQADRVGEHLSLSTQGGREWGRVLRSSGGTNLEYLSLGIRAEDAQVFAQRIEALGIACAPHPAETRAGLWFRTPDGQPWQLVVADKCSPSSASVAQSQPRVPGQRGTPTRGIVDKVLPRHLSHVMLFTPDVRRMLDFAQSFLGLRLSDHVDDGVAFTHSPHGSDHHLLAFAKSSHPGFHHTSWDVASIDEVGRGAQQMRQAGYVRGWGVGRHVLGSNYFHYVQMPAGGFAEYSFGIDFIGADEVWPSANHAPENAYYLWGPDHPEYMLDNPSDVLAHPPISTR